MVKSFLVVGLYVNQVRRADIDPVNACTISQKFGFRKFHLGQNTVYIRPTSLQCHQTDLVYGWIEQL